MKSKRSREWAARKKQQQLDAHDTLIRHLCRIDQDFAFECAVLGLPEMRKRYSAPTVRTMYDRAWMRTHNTQFTVPQGVSSAHVTMVGGGGGGGTTSVSSVCGGNGGGGNAGATAGQGGGGGGGTFIDIGSGKEYNVGVG